MGNHIPTGDGVIVVEYEQGTNSPVLLYFLRHRGWSFDMKTITPAVIEYLKTQGATHFATTDFLLLEDKRPDIIEYLRRSRRDPARREDPARSAAVRTALMRPASSDRHVRPLRMKNGRCPAREHRPFSISSFADFRFAA